MKLRRLLALLVCGLALTTITLDSVAQAPKDDKKEKKGANAKKGVEKVLPTKADSALIPAAAKPSPVADIARKLDVIINAKMSEQKLTASSACSDADFIRRVSLDITGVIPTAERVRAFLEAPETEKRTKLVEELLASEQFGTHQADIWQNLLYVKDSDNRVLSKDPLVEWLKKNFNENTPWNKTVYELLTASGDLEQNKELVYFLANRTIDKLADSVSKVFMGLQLQCAQCHNHPFSDWKQTEYWGLAQFFIRVSATNPRQAIKNELPLTVNEVSFVRRNPNSNPLPEATKMVTPKVPGGPEIAVPATVAARPYLARWLTAPDNPYFAKAMVNRLWFEFFGQGIVNPVDNLDEEDKSTHPELLAILSKEFVDSGYDLKHVIQIICATEAYQRSSKPTAGNEKDKEYYTHMAMKVMSPEDIYDSLGRVLTASGNGERGRKQAGGVAGGKKGPGGSQRDQFVAFFNGSENAKPIDYEAGIPQALRLMNNSQLNPRATTDKLAKSISTPEAMIDQLYLMAYARKPSESEQAKMKAFIAKQSTKAEAYADILWVLLNSSEFTLIR